jgi:hypothetical protein
VCGLGGRRGRGGWQAITVPEANDGSQTHGQCVLPTASTHTGTLASDAYTPRSRVTTPHYSPGFLNTGSASPVIMASFM